MTLNYKFDGDVYGGYGDCDGRDIYGGQAGCDECGRDSSCDDQLVLAIATVPMQKWRMTYSPEKALCAGTMFAELNLPFKGGKCR